jgi:hypothetical protein
VFRILLAGILAFAVLPTAVAVELEGIVQSIDSTARKLSITRKTTSGDRTLTLDVSPKAGDIASLKPGDRAALDYDTEQELVTKISSVNAGTPSGSKPKSGEPTPVSVTGRRSVDGGSEMEMATWSPDGRKIASASYGNIRVWDAQTLKLQHELKNEPSGGLAECLFTTRDGSSLAAPTNDGIIQLWDLPTERAAHAIKASGQILAMSRTVWGDTVLVRLPTNLLETYSINDLTKVSSFRVPAEVKSRTRLASFPSRNLVAMIGQKGDIIIVNVEDRVVTKRITPPEPLNPHNPGLTASRDGSKLAVGAQSGSVFVYDTATWNQICHCELKSHPAYAVGFSNDGRLVVSGGVDWGLRVWDAESGRLLKAHMPGEGQISSVSFSPNGENLLFTQFRGGQRLFVWAASTLLD